MSPAGRMKAALNLKVPDRVPTFELEFQLTDELVGQDYLRQSQLDGVSSRDRERLIRENAELIITIYEKLGHDAICLHHLDEAGLCATAREIRRLVGDKFLLLVHGDGTFAIPDGSHMLDFAYRMADEPEALHAQAWPVTGAIGATSACWPAALTASSCAATTASTRGRFFPRPVRRVHHAIPGPDHRKHPRRGGFAIKHTDGNIMPILDQLVACRPHPCIPWTDGRVDNSRGQTSGRPPGRPGRQRALRRLQTGTDDDVIASARYAMTPGKPGGATSSAPATSRSRHAPGAVPAGIRCLSKGSGLHRPERLENGQVNA
jgi:uroporphyrinogen decarboxylase